MIQEKGRNENIAALLQILNVILTLFVLFLFSSLRSNGFSSFSSSSCSFRSACAALYDIGIHKVPVTVSGMPGAYDLIAL